MAPLLIKFALKSKGISISELARTYVSTRTRAHVSEKTVRSVIDGSIRSAGIERRIADVLELPIQEVFPRWYSAAGKRLRKPRTSMTEALAKLREVQASTERKREAA